MQDFPRRSNISAARPRSGGSMSYCFCYVQSVQYRHVRRFHRMTRRMHTDHDIGKLSVSQVTCRVNYLDIRCAGQRRFTRHVTISLAGQENKQIRDERMLHIRTRYIQSSISPCIATTTRCVVLRLRLRFHHPVISHSTSRYGDHPRNAVS